MISLKRQQSSDGRIEIWGFDLLLPFGPRIITVEWRDAESGTLPGLWIWIGIGGRSSLLYWGRHS